MTPFIFVTYSAPGGHSTFSGRSVQPDFRSVGLQTDFCLWKRGLVELKFSNLGAWKLKLGQKLRLYNLKFLNFSQKGVLWTYFKLFSLKWDPCKLRERHEKGVFRAVHTPLSGSVPPQILPILVSVIFLVVSN